MSDLEAWIARSILGAIIAACVGIFVRVRKLESGAAVAGKSIRDLENRPPANYGDQLEKIDAKLEGLSTRLAKVETKLESRGVDNLWTEHRDLAKSVARTKADVAEQAGLISQLGPLVNRLDNYLRTVQAGHQ